MFENKVAVVTGGAKGTGKVIADYGHVDYLINNALPLMKGIRECSYEEFNYALRVGVTAPFYLTKLFACHFAPGAAIVNISSSRDRMSQPQTESYTAAKGGISALAHALDPMNTLARGYLMAKSEDGKLLRLKEAQAGQQLILEDDAYRARCRVESVSRKENNR